MRRLAQEYIARGDITMTPRENNQLERYIFPARLFWSYMVRELRPYVDDYITHPDARVAANTFVNHAAVIYQSLISDDRSLTDFKETDQKKVKRIRSLDTGILHLRLNDLLSAYSRAREFYQKDPVNNKPSLPKDATRNRRLSVQFPIEPGALQRILFTEPNKPAIIEVGRPQKFKVDLTRLRKAMLEKIKPDTSLTDIILSISRLYNEEPDGSVTYHWKATVRQM